MLLKLERQSRIRRLVEEKGQVTVTELSSLLHVSEATIRRDLDNLNGEGVVRTHGGAVAQQSALAWQGGLARQSTSARERSIRDRSINEPPVVHRLADQVEEKRRIGQAAAAMVHEGETIFISSGTTALEVARALPPEMHLTVISNSLLAVNELANCRNIELLIIGGMFRQGEFSMVGHAAELAIREFRANRTFIGMRAIDLRFGFTNDYMPEVQTDRAIINMASQMVVLADHTKFGRVFPVFVAPVTAAQMIITDSGIDPAMADSFRGLGIELTIA